MDELNNILSQDVQIRQLKRFQTALRLSSILKHKWPSIIGKLGSQLSFGYLRGPNLVLYSDNPIWQTEMRNFQPMLLTQIKEKTNIQSIKQVKVFPKPPEKKTEKPRKLDPSLTLLERIRLVNEERINAGEKLCRKCGRIYTKKTNCVFCVSQRD